MRPRNPYKVGPRARAWREGYEASEYAINLARNQRLYRRFDSRTTRTDPTKGSDGVSHVGFAVWKTPSKKSGYGSFRVGRRIVGAPRFSLEKKLGRPLGKDLCALHRCDYRACVDERHLFEGTKGDNNRDRAAKGRSAKTLRRRSR